MTSATENRSGSADRMQADLDAAIRDLRGVFEAGVAPAAPRMPVTPERRVGIFDIPISLQIVVGSIEMPVADIMALEQGAVVTLDRAVGDPVDIVANGRCIARGELTVTDGPQARLAIRITEVADR